MVPFRVLSRTNLAGSSPSTSSISFTSFRLRTLDLSLRSFSDSRPLFSTTSTLFSQNTRGGIPLRDLVRCTEAQKCLFVSPLLATLAPAVSRNSFPCHSYANTRDMGVTAATKFRAIFLATRHSPLSSRALLGREGLEGGVDQVRIVELGFVAGILAANGQEAGGERLVPLDRQAGHVSDNQLELLLADVAGERHCVEAGAAYGAVTQQRVEGDAPFAPALRQPGIFQDRQHQAGVAGLLHLDVADGGGERVGGRQGSARAHRLRGQGFQCRANRDVLERGGGKMRGDVGPASGLGDARGLRLHRERFAGAAIGERLVGRGAIGSA